ncbi:hypothetical protein EDD18DRAFT_1355067 [Armillaria luteobubalina]|uniref:Uncharacterized protein n=1 Tax=Armillaria luteobubalina TaxID=153913 RepID=A0AA39Q2U3_9AGAR|nr:hypothetical protein EDD18DRAFT_1355067 [Armillaria luteobubalina]
MEASITSQKTNVYFDSGPQVESISLRYNGRAYAVTLFSPPSELARNGGRNPPPKPPPDDRKRRAPPREEEEERSRGPPDGEDSPHSDGPPS